MVEEAGGGAERLLMREVNLLIRSEASTGVRIWSPTPRSHTSLKPFAYLILSPRHPQLKMQACDL